MHWFVQRSVTWRPTFLVFISGGFYKSWDKIRIKKLREKKR